MKTQEIFVENIKCGGCMTSIKNALEKIQDEEVREFSKIFLKYLSSPVIKDAFLNYSERREWGHP